MNYFSMFTGIGTGEKGIEQAYENHRNNRTTQPTQARVCGHRVGSNVGGKRFGRQSRASCVGFSEIDRHAEAIYRYHWPEHRNFGDATKIICDELPDFDFLIAGFPCQSFSIAGKRQGFNEARGTLFFEIARILSHKRPAHFLLENVRGLVSHDAGKTLQRILRILADLDYFVEVVVLNSKDHGVPQNRERVFFVGHLASECSREILSFGDGGEWIAEASGKPREEGERIRGGFASVDTRTGSTARGQHLILAQGVNHPSRGVEVRKDGLAAALKSGESGTQRPKVMAVDTKNVGPARFTENVACLGANDYKEPKGVMLANRRIRRLTPIECERLQGLSDDFTKYGRYGDEIKEVADTNRYKGLGNAFTVNVVEALITRMIETGCLK